MRFASEITGMNLPRNPSEICSTDIELKNDFGVVDANIVNDGR